METLGSQTVFADSSVAYAYIKSVFKKCDFVFITADFIQYLTGDRAVAEAQKNGDADTSYNEKGKLASIYVANDFYMVNSRKYYGNFGCQKRSLLKPWLLQH